MTNFKAIDLPEVRQRMLRHLSGPGREIYLTQWADEPADDRRQAVQRTDPDWVIEREIDRWRLAELYFVTREMTELARLAGRSLPDFELHREDLPAEHGLLYCDGHIANYRLATPGNATDFAVPVRAVSWGIIPAYNSKRRRTAPGVWLTAWLDAVEIGRQLASLGHETPLLAHAHGGTRLIPHDFFTIELGTDTGQHLVAENPLGEMLATVYSAWLLMQQEVATLHPLQIRRSTIRAMQRRHLNPSKVRVVALRRLHSGKPEGDCSERQYTHRWLVRGHWRKQWYPSQQRHVPIWINAHVKGPDNAPFLTGELVHAWRR